MDFDEQLRHDMRSAVGTIVSPPATELVDGGVQRGRRMKRMRMARVVGGVATVAMLGGVVAVNQFPGGFQEAPADVAVASGGVQAVPPEEQVPVTSQVVVQTLIDLLPEGEVSHLAGDQWPSDSLVTANGDLVFDDGAGAAQVMVSVGQAHPGISCEPPHPEPSVQCTELEQPDGSVVVIIQRPEYTDGSMPGMLTWTAQHLRTDGTVVELTEFNSAAQKVPPPSRELPPLTVEQLTEIVTSPQWRTEVPKSEAMAAEDLFEPRIRE